MYPSRRRQTYVNEWSAVLPLALNTPICPRHPGVTEHCSVWEVIKRPITSRLHRNLTSPGYSAGSANWLLKYHCPSRLSSPSVGGNPTSLKVSFDRSLLEGEILAHLLSLACSLIANVAWVKCLMNGIQLSFFSDYPLLAGNWIGILFDDTL